jgi:hypothetical protein
MKKIVTMLGLTVLLNGCSWIGHGDSSNINYGGGTVGGVDYSPGRGHHWC